MRQQVLVGWVYADPAAEDGVRVLVDRLWPPRLSEDSARLGECASRSPRRPNCPPGSAAIRPASSSSPAGTSSNSMHLCAPQPSTACANSRATRRSPCSPRSGTSRSARRPSWPTSSRLALGRDGPTCGSDIGVSASAWGRDLLSSATGHPSASSVTNRSKMGVTEAAGELIRVPVAVRCRSASGVYFGRHRRPHGRSARAARIRPRPRGRPAVERAPIRLGDKHRVVSSVRWRRLHSPGPARS